MENVKITYLHNSALLLKSKNNKLLIDGLVSNGNHFCNMSLELERSIIEGKGDFRNIDALLYTHDHMDHFDRDKTEEFKLFHKETFVLEPGDGTLNGKMLTFGDFQVELCLSGHLHVQGFPDAPHYSFLIDIYGEKIFIASDIDLNRSGGRIWGLLKSVNVSAAFFNPLVLATAMSRQLLKEIGTGKTYIYHLPPAEADKYMYRALAETNLEKHKEELPNVSILGSPMMEL